jgi:hypothetical protein
MKDVARLHGNFSRALAVAPSQHLMNIGQHGAARWIVAGEIVVSNFQLIV